MTSNDELRRLAEKATQGEWKCTDIIDFGNHKRLIINDSRLIPIVHFDFYTHEPPLHTPKFIAAANPQTILALLDEIKEERRVNRDWEQRDKTRDGELTTLRKQLEMARTDVFTELREWLKQRANMFSIHDPAGFNIGMAISALEAKQALKQIEALEKK